MPIGAFVNDTPVKVVVTQTGRLRVEDVEDEVEDVVEDATNSTIETTAFVVEQSTSE